MSAGRRSNRLLRVLLPLLILLLSGAGFAGLMATRDRPQPVAVEEKVWLVEAVVVSPGSHSPELLLYGTLESPQTATLRAGVTADVMAVPAAEGRAVKRGELLVQLDDRDLELLVERRRAEQAEIEAQLRSEETRYRSDKASLSNEQRLLELARREVARVQDLRQRGLSAERQLDEARRSEQQQLMALVERRRSVEDYEARRSRLEARMRGALAARQEAELDLQRTRVLAPFDGRITRVAVAVGDRVRPGDALVALYDLEALEVRAQIPSRHLARVRGALSEGAELTAVATLDGRPLELRLDRLGGAAATASGGVDALFKLDRPSALLTLGRTVALNLRLPREQGVVELPFEALYGLDRVYRLQGDRMQGVRVERVGERRSGPNSRVLVRSADLQAGDRVVVTQLPNALDGLRVQVRLDD